MNESFIHLWPLTSAVHFATIPTGERSEVSMVISCSLRAQFENVSFYGHVHFDQNEPSRDRCKCGTRASLIARENNWLREGKSSLYTQEKLTARVLVGRSLQSRRNACLFQPNDGIPILLKRKKSLMYVN